MTAPLRNLIAAKIAATLRAESSPSNTEILVIPTAAEATKSYTLPLTCRRTGIIVGSLNVATLAGHMPMVGQWKESMVLHPLFSLDPVPLIKFSKNTWFRYCGFSVDEGADDRLTAKQEQILQVAALAMMYHLTDVRQDIPWLPAWKDIAAHWPSLIAISYWKAYLDSARFRFPHVHISMLEREFELGAYLQTCWAVKKSYESTVSERVEVERLRAAESATIALREEIAGVRPASAKYVWRWFLTHLPKRYEADSEGWMRTIFFAKGEDIRNFTMADIDLFEEIFLCECPTGSSISHAFSETLASKRDYLQQHFEAFEIIVPQSIAIAKAAGEIPKEEPLLKDFDSKAKWMVARAKWKLAHTDIEGNIKKAMQRQATVTVNPSYVPKLPDFLNHNNSEDEEQGDDLASTDVESAVDDDSHSVSDGGEIEE